MSSLPQVHAGKASHADVYRHYLALWENLNAAVDEEDRMVPANGDRPTYGEVRRFYKLMKQPLQRKLFWAATGYLHPEFPDDEAQFQREEADGMIEETNVTTMEESSDDDDFYDENAIPDLNDENAAPIRNASFSGIELPSTPERQNLVSGNEENSPIRNRAAAAAPLIPNPALNVQNNADRGETISPRDLPNPIVVDQPESSPDIQVDDSDSVAPSPADQESMEEDGVESDSDSDLPSTREVRKDLKRLRAEALSSSSDEEEDESEVDDYDSMDSLDGFVVDDDEEDSGSCEEVSTSDNESSDSHTPSPKRKIDEDVYSFDDENRRDLPKTISKAMKRNSPVTPKAAPFLANPGKPRYSSDNAPAERRRLVPVTPLRSALRHSCDQPSTSSATPIRRSLDTSRPGPRRIIDQPSTSSAAIKKRSSNSSTSRPGPSKNNTVTPVIPAGYEKISDERRKNLSDAQKRNIIILTFQNGKPYFRKYDYLSFGKIDESRNCMLYQCIQCQEKGKETWVKVQSSNNACYAEINHHPKCELKEWNL